MKRKKYDFYWFEKEERRSMLRASVGKDEKLRLGRALKAALPQFIRIGFDTKACVLAIADGGGEGINCPACGVLNAQSLSERIVSTGLRLPVSFRIVKDAYTGFFLGEVIPHQRTVNGQKQYDTAQLLVIYRHLVDDAVCQMAKSTPRAERRAIAEETFCAAVRDYHAGPWCAGNLFGTSNTLQIDPGKQTIYCNISAEIFESIPGEGGGK